MEKFDVEALLARIRWSEPAHIMPTLREILTEAHAAGVAEGLRRAAELTMQITADWKAAGNYPARDAGLYVASQIATLPPTGASDV